MSLVIRDRSGRLVAEIVNNEWKVNPQNAWDRNYSADALEVRDPTGDIVLQVKALADRIIASSSKQSSMTQTVAELPLERL